MLSSDLGRDSKLYTGGKVQLPYNVVKGAFEVAINNGDKNLIIQFLRLTLDNCDSAKCFYYSKVQIELLHYLYSIDLEQALSTVRYTLLFYAPGDLGFKQLTNTFHSRHESFLSVHKICNFGELVQIYC